MSTLPAKASTKALDSLAAIARRAASYAEAATAPNTHRAYGVGWRHFEAWCARHRLAPLPAKPGTVAAYLADHAGSLAIATLRQRLACIKAAHRRAGHPLDTQTGALAEVWAGIRRTHCAAPAQKRALVTAELRTVIKALPGKPIGARDRALLLIGFASAMRRSELAALCLDGPGHRVRFTDNGLAIELGRTKADQEGGGKVIGVPFGSHAETCPVRALRAWLDVAGIASGPVFRSVNRHGQVGSGMTPDSIGRAVQRAVYRATLAAGASESEARAAAATVGGHSLRAGFVTAADAAGAPFSRIMAQTRHARVETARGYLREADAFKDNAASYLGL